MEDINNFEISLKKNEVDKFLLGEGFYFYNGGEMERYKHAASASWVDIVNYLKKNPDKIDFVYQLLDDTIIQILETKQDLSLINFLDLELFVWCYLADSQEEKNTSNLEYIPKITRNNKEKNTAL
jgi:hypothetical protein